VQASLEQIWQPAAVTGGSKHSKPSPFGVPETDFTVPKGAESVAGLISWANILMKVALRYNFLLVWLHGVTGAS